MNNKGQMGNLTTGALALVTAAVVIGMGAYVLAELSGNSSITGDAQGAIDNGTEGLASLGKFLPIIAVVVAAAVILGLIAGGFMLRR